MAEGVVGFLLSKVDSLLVEERRLLSGVRGEVEGIRDELESMQAFLKDADAREEGEEGVKTWVKQVRELAYDTEDVLDEFLFKSVQQPHHSRSGFAGFVFKTTHCLKRWKMHRRVAIEIQFIETRARSISERRGRYNFNRSDVASSSTTRLDPRGDVALLIEEAELVGINQSKGELISLLLEGEPRLRVVSVVGMAGLGKTAIVKKVFDDPRIQGFFLCHAWIAVSQSFRIREILRDLFEQLFSKNNPEALQALDSMNDARLKEMIREFLLPKSYVIVFDDIWNKSAWSDLKYMLPDSNCGSRIMTTTRILDVATYCSESYGHVYHLNSLPKEEAWLLFCRRAFRFNPGNICPSELELLSENILSRCKGLPLAIVAIGGLLSMKNKTVEEWGSVLHRFGSELESNQSPDSVMKILLLSFNDLPYHQKSCFLYLGVFPEDYPIERKRLIRLWVADGLVEEKQGFTVEEVAESYLNEFFNRNLILAADKDISGRVKKWLVHDVMREFILIKSLDQNFASVVAHESLLPRKIRRLSIHKSNDILPQLQIKSERFYCIRSLLVFDTTLPVFLQFSRLLRVLDLKGALLDIFPGELVNLFHLRFLSLRETKIKKLPKSIGKLRNLETLDLKHTGVSELPAEIVELQRLRHLLAFHLEPFYGFGSRKGCKAPREIGTLVSLQTLTTIEGTQDTGMIKGLERLTQLRRLSITKLSKEEWILLCVSIEKMRNLRFLDLSPVQEEDLIDLQYISSPPPLLRRICLTGGLEKLPHWISLLHNLVRIHVENSRINVDNPLEALQALPNLKVIYLLHAYDGEELCFPAGGFQRLKHLDLSHLDGLRVVRVEKGSMPHLDSLSIYRCSLLEKAPLGIEDLKNLRQFIMYEMPDEFVNLLLDGGQDHWRIAHIPIRYVDKLKDGKWEGYKF